jgi:serine/threonine protein kinase
MTPGTKLGPYEIVALIGAGGMGEVYRAKDAKLDRDVALNVWHHVPVHDREQRGLKSANVLGVG